VFTRLAINPVSNRRPETSQRIAAILLRAETWLKSIGPIARRGAITGIRDNSGG
jgi:hypothetical protein